MHSAESLPSPDRVEERATRGRTVRATRIGAEFRQAGEGREGNARITPRRLGLGREGRLRCSTSVGTIVARYNIVPSGFLYKIGPGFRPFRFNATLRDGGDGQQVLLLLKQVDLDTAAETVIAMIDSDVLATSGDYQKVSTGCAVSFDFGKHAYYVEARIVNSDSKGKSPSLAALRLEGCPTL